MLTALAGDAKLEWTADNLENRNDIQPMELVGKISEGNRMKSRIFT